MKIVFALIVSGALMLGALSNARKVGSSTVVIEKMKFVPQAMNIKKGDSITWKNQDLVPHTVTSANGTFDSKTIQPGKAWTFHSKEDGTFSYHCTFHPEMSGSISVE